MDRRYFSEKLVEWYEAHRRDLPWRDTNDPYKIWLSEIILQQTRVNQGLPYYLKFIEIYPDVKSLAAASEEEILRLWQGLGYYSRARNLHKCAKQVAALFEGQFPKRYAQLLTLPGIGEYTAAAIASFSSGEHVAVVDGNVFRVLARIYGETAAINSPEGKRAFSSLANGLIPKTAPGIHNQAIMEFGALWCTPKTPKCTNCYFASRCFAATNSMQAELPVKLKAKKLRKRYFNYFVLKKGKTILMKRRGEKDIWNGLYDFYLVETNRASRPERLMESDDFLKTIKVKNLKASENYKHVLSHQTIISRFILMEEPDHTVIGEDSMRYYTLPRIHDLPKPVLISRFLKDFDFL